MYVDYAGIIFLHSLLAISKLSTSKKREGTQRPGDVRFMKEVVVPVEGST